MKLILISVYQLLINVIISIEKFKLVIDDLKIGKKLHYCDVAGEKLLSGAPEWNIFSSLTKNQNCKVEKI